MKRIKNYNLERYVDAQEQVIDKLDKKNYDGNK